MKIYTPEKYFFKLKFHRESAACDRNCCSPDRFLIHFLIGTEETLQRWLVGQGSFRQAPHAGWRQAGVYQHTGHTMWKIRYIFGTSWYIYAVHLTVHLTVHLGTSLVHSGQKYVPTAQNVPLNVPRCTKMYLAMFQDVPLNVPRCTAQCSKMYCSMYQHVPLNVPRCTA